eukprot:CAMPEP_0204570212 /NCGR_PEP_ID=MMETSP0661-20131031/38189_1 /ASSEMBLY_ACC=CAM_ASM_000606 /TAXON_ID=109239 /ORGANISM="Alexandrium margalefi, Strain AMGDE01CS-322" /LENGTH=58 /DNA_ID=CAMNT_0051578383 /DNA_START=14 /DNA_END=187 /DNA_ORIENTATION=-
MESSRGQTNRDRTDDSYATESSRVYLRSAALSSGAAAQVVATPVTLAIPKEPTMPLLA